MMVDDANYNVVFLIAGNILFDPLNDYLSGTADVFRRWLDNELKEICMEYNAHRADLSESRARLRR